MALSKQERNLIQEGMRILDRYMSGEDSINEAPSKKGSIADLKEVESILNTSKLSVLGEHKFPGRGRGSIVVSLFFMSNKNTQISKDMDNFLYLSYDIRDSYVNFRGDFSRETLESFIQLPINSDDKEAITSRSIVNRCDSNQIYNIYQDKALSIIRKLFPHAYYMFTGPNLFKSNPSFNPRVTLGVGYDPIRKRFKYIYNPDFILMCAIDEWTVHKNSYKSFEGCYTYILAFMITHEMLHIIHHNTTSSLDGDSFIDVGGHDIANIVQDSFINCKISRRFSGADGIKRSYGESAPMPSVGIGSRITVRCEHNEGFKKYKDTAELAEAVFSTIVKDLKLDRSSFGELYVSRDSLEAYEGADIFVSVDIASGFSPIRNNSSNLFQICFNDIVKCVTSGKVFDKFTPISDEEKVSDLDVLPEDTLVLVKGKRDICYVESYSDTEGLYVLTKSKVAGVRTIPQSDGKVLNITQYDDTGEPYGKKKRYQIKPYDPSVDAYISDPSAKKPKKDKLSEEDLNPQQQPPQPSQGGQQQSSEKVLCVGDIVWIRKLKKFGRITSIDNGVFNIEEVIEKPVKVLDDSLNH